VAVLIVFEAELLNVGGGIFGDLLGHIRIYVKVRGTSEFGIGIETPFRLTISFLRLS
jgi:hypothetical protein